MRNFPRDLKPFIELHCFPGFWLLIIIKITDFPRSYNLPESPHFSFYFTSSLSTKYYIFRYSPSFSYLTFPSLSFLS